MRWSTSRVEAFSDGVIAIAITLLVLEIRVDPADLADPWPALADQWPSYLAYVTSFLTVGSVWMAHHGIFSRLESMDAGLMRLNLALLMLVAFLPFPTRVLADALTQTQAAERAAVVVYGALVLAIELLLLAMARHGHVTTQPRRRRFAGIVAYPAAIVVALLAVPDVAAFAYLALAVRAVLRSPGEGRISTGRVRTD
jgi:uncharacterized membrane protein